MIYFKDANGELVRSKSAKVRLFDPFFGILLDGQFLSCARFNRGRASSLNFLNP